MATRLHDRRADEAQYQALEEARKLKAPDIGPIDLAQYQYTGDVNPELVDAGADIDWQNVDPELAAAVLQGDSEMQDIESDPRLRDAQMDALLELQNIAERGGRSAEDDANLMRVQNQNAQADRGRREAILQNMAARGMGGSGMELLAQLDSSQAATDRSAQQGLDIAALAQLRQQDALMNAGQMGGNIRSQDFGEQSEVAQAQDAINRFNASTQTQNNQFNAGVMNNSNQFNQSGRYDAANNNRQFGYNASAANAGIKNQAQGRNLDARQNIANAGVDTRNKQQVMNRVDIPQQNFQNQTTATGARTDALQSNATYNKGRGRDLEKDDRDDINAGTTAAAEVVKAISDERAKKDVKEVPKVDIEMFLATLEPKKFEYKDKKKHGDGKRTGVMAQDLLKSVLGQEAVVQEDDGTLGYDTQKMQGITLAALKHLSDKIDDKE